MTALLLFALTRSRRASCPRSQPLQLRPTLRTKLRRAFGLMTASRAGRLWLLRRRATLRAELRLAHTRATTETQGAGRGRIRLLRGWRRRRFDVSIGAHVRLRRVIRLPRTLVQLVARGVSFRLRVRRRKLFLVIGRAIFTLASLRV